MEPWQSYQGTKNKQLLKLKLRSQLASHSQALSSSPWTSFTQLLSYTNRRDAILTHSKGPPGYASQFIQEWDWYFFPPSKFRKTQCSIYIAILRKLPVPVLSCIVSSQTYLSWINLRWDESSVHQRCFYQGNATEVFI